MHTVDYSRLVPYLLHWIKLFRGSIHLTMSCDSDLWFQVVQFVERPLELQAVSSICKQLGKLVKSRGCWGRALRPLFDFPSRSAKELRMACDWEVIRLLPERFREATQIFVAGSFALHEACVRRGRLPTWYPRDIDVWLVNGASSVELGDVMADRMRDMGLCVKASIGCGDYVTEDRFDYHRTNSNQDYKRGLERGSCVITRVYDLCYSFDGIRLGTLSLIGTRAADPMEAGFRRSHMPPLLTAHKVMEIFDMDVCRVGLLPAEELVFYDPFTFDRALATTSAHQRLKANASVKEASREAKRRRKYEQRGFRFSSD